MNDDRIKLKYEDLEKLYQYLEKHCKGGYVQVKVDFPKMRFLTKTISMETREIVLWDDSHYMLPKIISEENL